jgi:hypothetical protein
MQTGKELVPVVQFPSQFGTSAGRCRFTSAVKHFYPTAFLLTNIDQRIEKKVGDFQIEIFSPNIEEIKYLGNL